MLNIKEQVLNLYFIDHKKQKEIAEQLNISKYTVSRIVTKDIRYTKEKEERKKQSKEENKRKTIKYIYSIRNQKQVDEYENVRKMHIQASMELSERNKPMNNKAYRDWNSSIYDYNEKNKSYVLKKGINVGADVPKRINWKV